MRRSTTFTMDSSEELEKILKTDTLGRVRISPERREAILDDFEQSGMSGRAYARLHGICYSTFINWARKRKHRLGAQGQNQPMSAQAPDSLELTFAEVRLGKPTLPGATGGLRVNLPGGSTLMLEDPQQVSGSGR